MTDESGNEPYNAGDPKHVKDAKNKAKVRDFQLGNQLKAVMSTAEGRMWLWELLASTGLFANPHRSTPYLTSFACGELNVGQRVLAQVMKECPELYLVMQKEQQNG